MKILFVSSEFPPGPGGIGTHAYQLACHLIQIGWETTVAAVQDYASGKEIRAFNQLQPFQIIRLGSAGRNFTKVFYRPHMLSRCIKIYRPDILLVSGDRMILLVAWLIRHYRLPWIAIEHGRTPPTAWERRLKRWSFQQATAAVCVSQYSRQQLLTLGIQPREIQVIPNGADAIRFKILPFQEMENFHASLGFESAHLLLTVGNVTERKGQDTVIRALPLILKEVPNTHYLIIGLPTKKKDLMKLAYELNVANYIHFIGVVGANTLLRCLNCCDVFVMVSRHTADTFEGYGIAVVEAALCGKAAVVSGNSGLAEAVMDGETGLIVPEDDETATAKAILSLLRDKQRRQRMGEVARKRALEKRTWKHRAGEYDKLLRSLL